MKKYGHRIIEALFKKREERTAICAELASRREANRDLRDIRVFEIGLSPEQFGDYEKGSRAEQEAVGYQIIENTMERLKGIVLTNGQSAEDYVKSFPAEPKECREVIVESILEVSRKGWPLNDMEIMIETRARNRKRLGIR